MKRTFNYLIALVITAIAMVSCLPEEDVFDETLLYGRWKSGTEYYIYNDNKTGLFWDSSETPEEYARRFNWELVKSDLTHIYLFDQDPENIDGVPDVFTITELTATTLKYKNDFESYTLTKVD